MNQQIKLNPFYGTPIVPLETVDDVVASLTAWMSSPDEYKHLRPGQYLFNHHEWEYGNSYQVTTEAEVYELFQAWQIERGIT